MIRRRGQALLAVVSVAGAALSVAWAEQPLRFDEVAQEAGIHFVHANGAAGDKLLPETMGSGLAVIDIDGDGQQDLYFVNSAAEAAAYRNNAGTFTEITDATGLSDSGFGMGVVAADLDADGDDDLYVTAYGGNRLLRNDDGRFTEIGAAAGVDDPGFGAGTAVADIDADGDLDLFAANYVEFDPANNPWCARVAGVRVYCGPEAYPPQPDRLYRNDGAMRFTDIAEAAGLLPEGARELGALFSDYDDDGDPDLYVAGDKTANLLYRNDGAGVFTEVGMLANVAFGEAGGALAGMGIAEGDVDRDGLPDWFVTNYQWEANSFYRGLGSGLFLDDVFTVGLGVAGLDRMGWGTTLFDADNDGDDDLFVANGHMDPAFEQQDGVLYGQANQLFRNDGGRFVDVSPDAGSGLAARHVSRGSVVADVDDDGDLDVVVSNNGGPAQLLRNNSESAGHWLRVELIGPSANRNGVGARLDVIVDARQHTAQVRRGSSYLSSESQHVHIGLGPHSHADTLRIRWPDGTLQHLSHVPAGRLRVEQP